MGIATLESKCRKPVTKEFSSDKFLFKANKTQ